MEVRHSPDQVRSRSLDTPELRKNFLIESLFQPGKLDLVYSHCDRAIVGSAVPTGKALSLTAGKELAAEYFAQRREIGVLNIGGRGTVAVDGTKHVLDNGGCLYIGRGGRSVLFSSTSPRKPAQFYLVSYPAHTQHPTSSTSIAEIEPVKLGSAAEANRRDLYKMIHPEGIASCQLVMGVTRLHEGSVWNTMPAHTHERRSEIYMYFDVSKDGFVLHLMGEPEATRHLVVRDRQAVISPSWSIHSGAGTRSYSFVWAMGGENQRFDDMDFVKMSALL